MKQLHDFTQVTNAARALLYNKKRCHFITASDFGTVLESCK